MATTDQSTLPVPFPPEALPALRAALDQCVPDHALVPVESLRALLAAYSTATAAAYGGTPTVSQVQSLVAGDEAFDALRELVGDGS